MENVGFDLQQRPRYTRDRALIQLRILTIFYVNKQVKELSLAENRINKGFFQLLESQFPISDLSESVEIKTPSDFANRLNLHVNHLNRVLKSVHQKSTTKIIQEKLISEAKRLLIESQWNVSEIAFCLGFSEVTHFNNFFKKLENTNPSRYRNSAGE